MNKQQGVTLLSLLIGLLIAMLCIISVLSLYRTVVYTGVNSRTAATHDTQLHNGFTTAQMLLQNAGFGLDPTIRNIERTNITLNGNTVSALVWKELNGIAGTANCYGLTDITGSTEHQFVLIKGTGCQSSGTVLQGVTSWSIERTLANLHDYSADSFSTQVSFEEVDKACTPFGTSGFDATVQHPNITISAKNSNGQDVKVTVCLLNIDA